MKILFISLGCDKNLADSEEMLGLLTAGGHEITDDETQADAIVINTCCFIGDAKEESVNTILEMARLKEEGKCRALIVAGCLAQRYKEEITEEIQKMADAYKMEADKIKELLGERQMEEMKKDIAVQKAAKLVAEAAVEA